MRQFLTTFSGILCLSGLGSSLAVGTRDQPPKWVDCPTSLSSKLKCLTIKVPLEYDDPKGETINITAVKMITNSTNKLGSAVFQWGGPGEPVASTLAQDVNGSIPIFGSIKQNFDIVAVDPRGVGINHPIKCDPAFGKSDLIRALYPNNETEFNDSVALYKSLGQSCLERTGKVIHHLDTATQAKDLESVRVAMGEGKLTYYGLSWGTLRGQEYAKRYPQNIRAMVLDGILDGLSNPFEFYLAQATSYTNVQSRFFDWATNDESSPLKGKDTRTMLATLVKQADEKPIPVSACAKSGLCFPDVNGNDIRGHGLDFLYEPISGFPSYAQAIKEATNGNWTLFGLKNLINNDESSIPYSMFGIICQDIDLHESWQQFQQNQIATAGLSLDMEGSVPSRRVSIGCKGWPTKVTNPQKDYKINSTSVPILLVHALWDPATPYQWAVNVNRKIDGSVLLTRAGEGHGSLSSPKTRQIMYNYLIDPVKNLPKHLTVIRDSVTQNETDGFSTRNLDVSK